MKLIPINEIPDPYLNVEVVAATEHPQKRIYAALHQDYSSEPVVHPSITEEDAGYAVLKSILKREFHGGPLEHPQIHFSCQYVPHSVMQQLRTHRVGVSFDCQSFRYTSESILGVTDPEFSFQEELAKLEKVIYLRPVGNYTNRRGKKYVYSEDERHSDARFALQSCLRYERKYNELGYSEEHCRGMLPFDYRQHFHLSGNLRSIFHILDLRSKADAQLECQWLAHLIMHKLLDWCPEVAGWYLENRFGKARLSP